MYVVDNVMPFIADEEDKLVKETRKILGRYTGDAIEPLGAPIAATCTRVPVRDGHTEAITLGLEREASLDEVAEAIAGYRGRAQELALPSAPAIPLVVRTEIDRPQPQLDRDVDAGRVVSVGRIRRHDAFENGVAYVAVGHNHDRGHGRQRGHPDRARRAGRPLAGELMGDDTRREITLREYAPRSQLRTERHHVARPRFPAVDIHNHLGKDFGGDWYRRSPLELGSVLDEAGVELVVDLDGGHGDHLSREIERWRPAGSGARRRLRRPRLRSLGHRARLRRGRSRAPS